MSTKRKAIYKVTFHNQGKVYELHAGEVSASDLYGCVEVGDLIFGERSSLLVVPQRNVSNLNSKASSAPTSPCGVRVDVVDKEVLTRSLILTAATSRVSDQSVLSTGGRDGDDSSSE